MSKQNYCPQQPPQGPHGDMRAAVGSRLIKHSGEYSVRVITV
jgi:hypothetical protein